MGLDLYIHLVHLTSECCNIMIMLDPVRCNFFGQALTNSESGS